eukprot:675614-Rhodomonas_salina.1
MNTSDAELVNKALIEEITDDAEESEDDGGPVDLFEEDETRRVEEDETTWRRQDNTSARRFCVG